MRLANRAIVAPATSGPTGERRKAERRRLVGSLLALDTAVLLVVVLATDAVRIWAESIFHIWPLATERHLIASLLVMPILLTIFRFEGLYDLDQILAGTREYARVAHSVTYGVFFAVLTSYVTGRTPIISRLWLVLIYVFAVVGVCAGRFAMRRLVRRLRRQGKLRTRVMVVGASTLGVEIADQLATARNEGIDVVGFLDEYIPVGQELARGICVIGRPDDLVHAMPLDLADEYVLVPQALPYERLAQLTRLMVAGDGPTVRMAVSSSDLLTNGILVAERGSIPLVTLQRLRITGIDAILKRSLDLTGALVALALMTAPVALALARGVALGYRPLLNRREIYGDDDQPIVLWLVSQSVSTRLALRGALALVAVIRGQVSLVGPRPIRYGDVLGKSLAHGLATVQPGLTGAWRVRGAEATLEEQTIEDLAYVRNYSIWEDLRIIGLTLWRSARTGRHALGRWEASERRPGIELFGGIVGRPSELLQQ